MAKKNEVVRCVKQQTIATYEVGDDFLVDVVLDGQMYDYWLYRKDCGIKVGYLQVPKANIAKPEDVGNCFNNMEFWDEDKHHYTDNYMV